MKKEKEKLTERQRAILDFIRSYIKEYGYPPSVREIAKGVGLYSSSTVHMHLRNLEEKGYLRRGSARSRALELLPAAEFSDAESAKELFAPNHKEEEKERETEGKASFLKGTILRNSLTMEVDIDEYGNIDTDSLYNKLSQLEENLANNKVTIFMQVHENEWDLEESARVLGEEIKPGDYFIVLLGSDFYPGDFWIVMQEGRLKVTRVDAVPLDFFARSAKKISSSLEKGYVVGRIGGIIRLFSDLQLTELL